MVRRSTRMFLMSPNLSRAIKTSMQAALLAVVCCSPLVLKQAFAQSSTTGAIGGTVTDSGGALLPNAQVKVTSVETQEVRTAKTNSSGEYTVPNLQPGIYTA